MGTSCGVFGRNHAPNNICSRSILKRFHGFQGLGVGDELAVISEVCNGLYGCQCFFIVSLLFEKQMGEHMKKCSGSWANETLLMRRGPTRSTTGAVGGL